MCRQTNSWQSLRSFNQRAKPFSSWITEWKRRPSMARPHKGYYHFNNLLLAWITRIWILAQWLDQLIGLSKWRKRMYFGFVGDRLSVVVRSCIAVIKTHSQGFSNEFWWSKASVLFLCIQLNRHWLWNRCVTNGCSVNDNSSDYRRDFSQSWRHSTILAVFLPLFLWDESSESINKLPVNAR